MLQRDGGGAADRPRKKDVSFNVLLDVEGKDMLEALAARTRQTQGAVIRWLVLSGYMMVCEGRPTCASGSACLVAHLHARQGDVAHMSGAPAGGGVLDGARSRA